MTRNYIARIIRQKLNLHPGLVSTALPWSALIALAATSSLMTGCWQKEGAPTGEPPEESAETSEVSRKSGQAAGKVAGKESRKAKGSPASSPATSKDSRVAAPGGAVKSTPSAGTVASKSGAEVAAAPAKKVEPPKPDRCVTISYKHKKLSSHSDGEACLRHKNIISLEEIDEKAVNAKTVCVRVNGTPVAHKILRDKKKAASKVMIDAVAGPNAVVSVRYCNGKARCSEDCSVPKDGFLDAIAGGIGAGDSDWAAYDDEDGRKTGGEKDKKISGELAQLKDAMEAADSEAPVFDQWMKDSTAGACGKRVASK